MTNRLNTPPAVSSLTDAVYQTVGRASACWENLQDAGRFLDENAADAADDLIDWIHEHVSLQELTVLFKEHWEMADDAGAYGHRSEAGIRAVLNAILGERPNSDG